MENLTNKQKVLIGILSVFILFGGYIFLKFKNNDDIIIENANQIQSSSEEKKVEERPIEIQKAIEVETPKKTIVVHVSGKVKTPGIVKITEGSRVFEAVENCGGISKDADADSINLAEVLYDGQKIYIPKVGENVEVAVKNITEKVKTSSSFGLVNINTASVNQLDGLPEIGPSTAQKIIEHRNSKGLFKKIDDLKNVPGIGEKKLEKIKKYITI